MSGTQIGVSTSAYMFFSGHLFETIWYLRRSSHFQPSDRWRPLLDDAFAKVAANSVSHGVTSGQQGRKSPSPQICASPCVSAVMCNSCPATHSRKMTRDEPGISAGPPREPAGPPGTAIDFFLVGSKNCSFTFLGSKFLWVLELLSVASKPPDRWRMRRWMKPRPCFSMWCSSCM
jgi:hypothetical protein